MTVLIENTAHDADRSHLNYVYDRAAIDEQEWSFHWVAHEVRPLVQQCGSPLEEQFVIALWSKCPTRGWPGNGIRPQVQIGPYRVDFVLDFRNYRHQSEARLVVEVDGHDFHEKTKEQVRQDKARDRYLLGQGYQVARFAGSEVYADPFKCAGEAWDLIESLSTQKPI